MYLLLYPAQVRLGFVKLIFKLKNADKNQKMLVVAILHIRNEELYIRTCISYLLKQGVKIALLDNDSDDRTLEICNQFSPRDILVIENVPFYSCYDLKQLLERVDRLRKTLQADWIVYQGADEILQSNRKNETLYDAILRIDRLGFDAINFDEFVFVPEANHKKYEGTNYINKMRYYYFYEPSKPRLIRAFKNRLDVDNIDSGGHVLPLDKIKLYEESLILRHYICLSYQHARLKYSSRIFCKEAIKRGWHHNRVNIDMAMLSAPMKNRLKKTRKAFCKELRTGRPFKKHFWEWDKNYTNCD